jgi:hypothetical protein
MYGSFSMYMNFEKLLLLNLIYLFIYCVSSLQFIAGCGKFFEGFAK